MSDLWDLDIIRKIAGIDILTEGKKPSSGMSKAEKSSAVKRAKKGEDMGKPGKNFKKIAKKAAARYGSKEAGEKVAGSIFWKKMAKENIEFDEDDIEMILRENEDEDDEDLSPAEKALAAKADKDLKAKGIKIGKIDVDKDIAKLAKRHKKTEAGQAETEDKEDADANKIANKVVKKEEAKPSTEKPADKSDEMTAKKQEPAEGNQAKKRGRVASDSSGAGKAKAWLKAHPNATRKEFVEHATKEFGVSATYAGTRYGAWKHHISEGYVLRHPSAPTFLLAEDREQNRYIWIDPTHNFDPLFLVSESEANRIAKYMLEWKGQYAVVEKIITDEDE